MKSWEKYGRLTVIRRVGRNKHGHPLIECRCDCGNLVQVELGSLRSGNTKSCGCYWREVVTRVNSTHGMTNTSLYNTWRGMKERCLNQNSSNYKNYGGRGIKICPEWLDFENFKKWALKNRYRNGLTIERIDNDGDYCPENCRWASRLEQGNNKRNNHMITYRGETKSVASWARKYGINYTTLQSRLQSGWPIEKALTIKPGTIKTGPKPKTTDERLRKIVGI